MLWIRFERRGKPAVGALDGDTITVHRGSSLFDDPKPTSETLVASTVRLLTPTEPTKLIGLWNNFGALAAKLNLSAPEEPLYFIKAPSSYLAGGETIRRPKDYGGRVVFEGELGIVIGSVCKNVDEAQAAQHIFGYTCVNDVTAVDVLNKDPSFAQWTRAKSYDTFGVFGPVVATGLDPETLTVRAILEGEERQNYPVSDMTVKPARLVSAISRDMTLEPGDVIACGTSVGAGRMKPGSTIEIQIEGIGTLRNRFEA